MEDGNPEGWGNEGSAYRWPERLPDHSRKGTLQSSMDFLSRGNSRVFGAARWLLSVEQHSKEGTRKCVFHAGRIPLQQLLLITFHTLKKLCRGQLSGRGCVQNTGGSRFKPQTPFSLPPKNIENESQIEPEIKMMSEVKHQLWTGLAAY